MSDEELDRDWKPSGRRPQSTIARSFSLELMDIFRIENSVADLDEQVERRKQDVHNKASELEALEARIREMEAMLKGQKPLRDLGASASASGSGTSAASPRHARPSLSGAFASAGETAAPADDQNASTPRPLEHRQRPPPPPPQQQQQQQDAQKYGGSRPGTARASQQAVPGALPPTPVGSEDGDAERD